MLLRGSTYYFKFITVNLILGQYAIIESCIKNTAGDLWEKFS